MITQKNENGHDKIQGYNARMPADRSSIRTSAELHPSSFWEEPYMQMIWRGAFKIQTSKIPTLPLLRPSEPPISHSLINPLDASTCMSVLMSCQEDRIVHCVASVIGL